MFGWGSPFGEGPDRPCDICGLTDCNTIYRDNDPLAKVVQGGNEMQSAHPPVVAPYRIIDPVTESVVYGIGQPVPYEDAVKYGLVEAEESKTEQRAQRKTADRAKRLSNDRSKKPEQDR